MIKLYGYKKCSTVKKSIKFLENHGINFIYRDNVEEKLNVEEIKKIHVLSKCDIKKLFNTSGILYRELDLKTKLEKISLEEKYDLLASNGMLVKRPILVSENFVLIGFKEKEWEEIV